MAASLYTRGCGHANAEAMTLRKLLPVLHATGTQTKVVGVEMAEVNPIADPTHRTGRALSE